MPSNLFSLLAGRNTAPLTVEEIRRATNVFLGLDDKVNARYEQDSKSRFRVSVEEQSGEQFGEIIYGPDIYPGKGVVDPNSALSLDAAAAHELTHYHRWRGKTAIAEEHLIHIDEALTSLQALFRYQQKLNQTDMLSLVADAMQRLHLYLQELESIAMPAAGESSTVGPERET